jgi:hypothetical protein
VVRGCLDHGNSSVAMRICRIHLRHQLQVAGPLASAVIILEMALQI